MRNKLYLLFTAVTAIFALFHKGDFPRFLLGFEFLLWLALFVWARSLRQRLHCTLVPPVSHVLRQQDIALESHLENAGILPIPELRLMVKCRDEYAGDVQTLEATAMLDSRETAQLRWTIQADHYGILTLWGHEYAVSDPLGVTRASAPFPEGSWQIAVLPPLSQEEANANLSGGGEDDSAVSQGHTDEPGGSYELRVYREGEPLRNVHWKLTAKTGELMVREYQKDSGRVPEIYLDLCTYGKTLTRSGYDTFLECVAAFAAGQLAKDIPFQFLWHTGSGVLCRMPVRSRQDAREALTALLGEHPYSETTHKENTEYEACLNLWGEITGTQIP